MNRPKLSRILIVLTLIAIPLVSAAALYSNILVLGSFNAQGYPIILRQVTPPQTGTLPAACTSNATMTTSYTQATQLASSTLTTSIWYKTGINFIAPAGTTYPVIENYNVTYAGTATPAVNDIRLVYCDASGGGWITLHPNFAPKVWSGTITPTSFVLPYGYQSTTAVMLSVHYPGTYKAFLWFTG